MSYLSIIPVIWHCFYQTNRTALKGLSSLYQVLLGNLFNFYFEPFLSGEIGLSYFLFGFLLIFTRHSYTMFVSVQLYGKRKKRSAEMHRFLQHPRNRYIVIKHISFPCLSTHKHDGTWKVLSPCDCTKRLRTVFKYGYPFLDSFCVKKWLFCKFGVLLYYHKKACKKKLNFYWMTLDRKNHKTLL